MANLSTLSLTSLLVVTLAGCAQTPTEPDTRDPASAASVPAGMSDRMAMMNQHMQAMRAMHDKMGRARTPEARQALMAEHMTLMQDGMTMLGGMGPGNMGMGDMQGASGKPPDLAARQQMMEKQMEMMRSMMQMMIDRMPAQAPAAK